MSLFLEPSLSVPSPSRQDTGFLGMERARRTCGVERARIHTDFSPSLQLLFAAAAAASRATKRSPGQRARKRAGECVKRGRGRPSASRTIQGCNIPRVLAKHFICTALATFVRTRKKYVFYRKRVEREQINHLCTMCSDGIEKTQTLPADERLEDAAIDLNVCPPPPPPQ